MIRDELLRRLALDMRGVVADAYAGDMFMQGLVWGWCPDAPFVPVPAIELAGLGRRFLATLELGNDWPA